MKRHLLTICVVCLLAPAASARPPYRRALRELLELPASSRLNDCRTCHVPPGADATGLASPGADATGLASPGADATGLTETDRPHNAFGKRLKALRAELRRAGKSHDITARLLAVADEDADSDGVANLLELLSGTFPADATDKPAEAVLAAARVRQQALLASQKGYRWRPFERVERPALPVVKNTGWVRNSIDVFIATEHEKRRLTPRPEAPREVLLRRIYLDLTGLPPTPAELHAFLTDHRPDAYERVVDRLLDSPRYGERWGRHWMDVWRYSDWAGFGAQVRDSQPHIWHWRDWIIESLNADVPYDQMVQLMLAADEIAPTDPQALRATGYLVRNYKLLSREKWLQDTVDHTAMAFLGVTLGCARCHDHMYDAITQKEYFQVRAIFTPHRVRTDRLPGWPDIKQNGLPRVYDADLKAPTYLFIRGDDRTPDKRPLEPGVPEALGGSFEVRPVSLPREAFDPDRRAFVIRETLDASTATIEQMSRAVEAARAGLVRAAIVDDHPLRAVLRLAGVTHAQEALRLAELDADLARARHAALEAVLRVEELEVAGKKSTPEWQEAAKKTTRRQRQAALLEARRALATALKAERVGPAARRAQAKKQVATAKQALTKAEAAVKQPDSTAYTPRKVASYPSSSTGRRLAFARWIANRDNPLAARVAVNHIWQRHFGRALAPGVFDLGRNAQPPTHPALLDWLAVEFMERGWSMKALHRLIVTSATYRQASTPLPANLERDPDNVYLWRFTPRRLEAEVVRDAIFYVAGQLDQRMGGPDIPHAQGLSVPRRSLYFQHAAEKQMEFLRIFDVAPVTECYERKQAIMPQQALALVNSDLVLQHARLIARELHAQSGNFIRSAFERVLGRGPTAEEEATCASFLREQSPRLSGDGVLRARENLVHVLMNHHEFSTLR